jgi:maleylpyruvate isomerase
MNRRDVTPELVESETDRLLETVASFDDAALSSPSLCEGWTRGHVLAHLARNADGLARIAAVATTGREDTMYDSADSRDGDIEAGAGRSVAEQASDLRASADRLGAQLDRLRPEHGGTRVERTPGSGVMMAVGSVPFLRLREVVFHHVDLDAGFTFADAPDDVLELFFDDAVARLERAKDTPDVTLVTTEGDERVLGTGSTRVSGARAGVLFWLARGRTDQVEVDGPLPALPFGG